MKIKVNLVPIINKYSKYLFLFGISLLIAGLLAFLISNKFTILDQILITSGAIISLVSSVLLLKNSQGFWQRRSTQASTNALVATLSIIVILGLLNFLANRYYFRLDLTENKLFTLSPQSQEIVKNLDQPIKVWVFERQDKPISQELLENYHRYNPENFQFQFVDPEIEIGLAKKFNVQVIGEVYIESNSKRQLVQTLSEDNDISEIQLTNGILKIKGDRPEYVYFLQGHGEPPLDTSEGGMKQAVTALESQGYQVKPLNLAETGEIPDNVNTIIVAGAKRKLFEGEVEALQKYLDQGGNLLLMLDPKTDPGLEVILQAWGVKLDERIVIDGSGRGDLVGLGPATPLISSYGNHPITKDFGNNTSTYPLSRPIATVKVKNVEATALLVTDERTWAESNLESGELEFNPNSDIQGPLDLAVALVRRQPQTDNKSKSEEAIETKSETDQAKDETKVKEEEKDENVVESRLIVFGGSTFATNGWFQQQLNGDIFINSVKWLARTKDNPLSIRPREPQDRRLNLSPMQASIIGWLALFILPLFGLFTAGIAWWRRR